jgi:RHS repeat-associated protein
MVYDKWDRVVWLQTAQQREKGLWTFKKYDALNRLIMSGEKSENRNRVDLQNEATAWNGSRYESHINSGVYYSFSNSYPQLSTTADIREVFFYDSYTDWLPSGMGFDGLNAYHSQHPEFQSMATGGMVRNTENNNFMTYANYYDNKHRIIQTFAQNLYGNIERTDFKYNFAGELLETKSLLRDENNVATIQIERFEYDNAGGRTIFKVAMGAAPTETVCSYEYNEIRQQKTKKYYPNRQYGQIPTTPEFIIRPPSPTLQNTQDIAKRYILLQPNTVINSSNLNSYLAQIGQGAVSNVVVQGLQTMNFGHHVRGMMNCVNCASGLPVLDDTQNDIFANKLNFEENGLFDGNISKEIWKSKLNTGSNRSYTHTYDPAKRILASAYTGDMYSGENFNFSVNGYDKNGNITGLNRNGARILTNGIPTAFGLIDQLTYFYNGNRLAGIADGATGNDDVGDFRDNNSNSDYTYWTDGSLKSDANKGISLIDYDTYLNKPKSVTYSDGQRWIHFYYTSGGTKIKQTNSASEELHYTSKSIYQRKNSVTALYQISQSEGRILPVNGGFVFEFQYNDHLGNLRASFRDSLASPVNGIYPPPVITQENSYFPFGLEHKGTDFYRASPNQFQYNGKEKINTFNLGWSDYGFRTFDLQNARFISSDPLASQFPELTNYQYASNNPISNIDLDGLEGGRSNQLTSGQQENIKKTFQTIRKEVDRANSRATTLLFIQQKIEKQSPSLLDKVTAYGYSYIKQFGGYSDANDASVLTQGKNLDGKKATTTETIAAGVGIFLPLVAGSSFVKLLGETGEVEAKMFAKQANSKSLNFSIKDGAVTGLSEGKYDFVITNNGELKIGSGHYGLADEAKSVKGAGEIYIDSKGKIQMVNNNSGHYQPNTEQLVNQAKLLQNTGLTGNDFHAVKVQ